MAVGAVRGAVRWARDDAEHTREQVTGPLTAVPDRNLLAVDGPGSVMSAATPDPHRGFPAVAARRPGTTGVPPAPAREPDAEGSVPRAARIPARAESGPPEPEAVHVRLGAVATLREDLAQ